MTKIHLQSTYSDIVSDGGLDPRNEYEKKFKQMPLTQEQIEKIYYSVPLNTGKFWWDFARAIEQAHGIGMKDEPDSSVT
jgi:hypothetical protein